MYKQFYRRNLPHQQPPGAVFFITANLAGCFPKAVQIKLREDANRIRKEYASQPPDCPEMVAAWKRLFGYADKELDCSKSYWYLQDATVAQSLVDAFHEGASLRHYVLHRYCVMPNHIHVLLEPLPQNVDFKDYPMEPSWPPLYYRQEFRDLLQAQCPLSNLQWKPLGEITKAIKSVSALAINERFGKQGTAWNNESFDHWVRNEEEYNRILDYIDQNPVKAGLCGRAEDWMWSYCGK